MTLTELQAEGRGLGIKLTTGELASNHWLKLMGLGKFNSNDPAMRRHNHKRTPPSQLVTPVRVRDKPGEWGVAGFRLRFRASVTQVGDFEQSDTPSMQVNRVPIVYPDHDEIDWPQPDSRP